MSAKKHKGGERFGPSLGLGWEITAEDEERARARLKARDQAYRVSMQRPPDDADVHHEPACPGPRPDHEYEGQRANGDHIWRLRCRRCGGVAMWIGGRPWAAPSAEQATPSPEQIHEPDAAVAGLVDLYRRTFQSHKRRYRGMALRTDMARVDYVSVDAIKTRMSDARVTIEELHRLAFPA
jgi:hypothetical protein